MARIVVLDKLSLVTSVMPDTEYLKSHGELMEDKYGLRLYKYMYRLHRAVLLACPHKFSASINEKIAFTKVEINPQRFECYDEMLAYLFSMFKEGLVSQESFSVTRIDIAVDLENFPLDCLLGMLRIKRIRSDSLSFFKGTIYAGSDPKIRIYDKTKELKSKEKKGKELTAYEEGILGSGKSYTRFEIQIRGEKKNLQDIKTESLLLRDYFDRLEFFQLGDNGTSGILHILYKYINRKFRKEIERYKNHNLVEELKERYKAQINDWFSEREPF